MEDELPANRGAACMESHPVNRRDFLSAAGRHAAAAAAVATPVLAATADAGSALYDRLADQLGTAREALEAQLDALSGELRTLGGRVSRIEFQQQMLLYLLLLSFVVDGGLTWLVMHVPAAPIV